jgi:hypothetical protein
MIHNIAIFALLIISNKTIAPVLFCCYLKCSLILRKKYINARASENRKLKRIAHSELNGQELHGERAEVPNI